MATSFDLALALAIVRDGKPCNRRDAVELADRLDVELRRRARFATVPTLVVASAIRDNDVLRDEVDAAVRRVAHSSRGGVEAAVRDTIEDHAGVHGVVVTDVPGRVVPIVLTGADGGGYALPALTASLLTHAFEDVAWEEVADVLADRPRG